MARLQQSIDIDVPVRIAYNQLTQFEEYPHFMDSVDAVRQLDDTHLHWSGTMAGRNVEWDAEITERRPDQCIAWRNIDGPRNAGRVELQPLGREQARVTLTMECEPRDMMAGAQGAEPEAAMQERLEQDLARFKTFIETRGGTIGQTAQRFQEQASLPFGLQRGQTTQSETMLSQADGADDDGRFSIAAEQNFDQQSDQARRVGRMPQAAAGADPSDAMAASMQKDRAGSKAGLEKSIERAVPPSEEPSKR